jgi:serine/threonine protein kinase
MTNDVFELVGKTVDGKYRVDEEIGEGGFGVVYRGWHVHWDTPIAIKCLKVPPLRSEERRAFLDNFRSEGKLLNRLRDHRSFVGVYDFGVKQIRPGVEVPYLILEWLHGHDLERILDVRAVHGAPAYAEHEALALLRYALHGPV